MKQPLNLAILLLAVTGFSPLVHAVNNAPADVDTVTLRTSCTQGAVEVPNCFDSMSAVWTWLRTVRSPVPGPANPTLVNIGPGTFAGATCSSSNVTLRGSGRNQTVITSTGSSAYGGLAAFSIVKGCTNLSVQDMTIDSGGGAPWGVIVFNVGSVTSWTNVEINSQAYGWEEHAPPNGDGTVTCANYSGEHKWFSSRIHVLNSGNRSAARAYTANCATSWFWGSEIKSEVTAPNTTVAFALGAQQAEVHLYGSDVRLILPTGLNALGFQLPTDNDPINGQFLMAALQGSEIHIHGTGLDVIHNGTGRVDMLYTDAYPKSHFHATASGFSMHLGGTGTVARLNGPGRIEAPYTWGQGISPPLSTNPDGTPTANGVQTLISRNGADRFTETDCPLSGNCSLGGNYPHEMIYRAECTSTAANQGPWFDMTTQACRQ